MPTDAQLLTLMQWFSPAYPIGAFNFSHGLEAAIDTGQVHSADSLHAWLDTVLRHGAGRADALILAASYFADSPDELNRIDSMNRAFAPSQERLQETERQGMAFVRITRNVWSADLPALTYPVAVGRAACLCELPLRATSCAYLHAFIANLTSAAQRLMRLGQSEAQRILSDFAPVCAQIAQENADGDLARLSSSAFLADIASMQHETQYSRMFQT